MRTLGIPDATAQHRAGKLVRVMRAAFVDAETMGWESREGTDGLPDEDDEHVVAAAVIAGAGAIVAENFTDFPLDKIPLAFKSFALVTSPETWQCWVRHVHSPLVETESRPDVFCSWAADRDFTRAGLTEYVRTDGCRFPAGAT